MSDKFNAMADSVENHIDELNDMLHRRDQFVADFTHEIKTPMTAIIGYADTIRSVDLTRDEQVKAAGYIFSEGKRLEQMSMKLFDLLYIKDRHIEKNKCSARLIGEDVITSTAPILKDYDVKSDFDNAMIMCEPGLIKTVLINLIDNARKASEEGAVIEVYGRIIACFASAENDDNDMSHTNETNNCDFYEFSVRDYGIGIPQEDIDRICDEFYMVDKSRARSKGGAGLGLSLANIILQEHDSKLEIVSEVGKGTCMSFLLEIVADNI